MTYFVIRKIVHTAFNHFSSFIILFDTIARKNSNFFKLFKVISV